MRLIYIAHPFGGEQENVEKVEKIIKGLLHKHPDCTFYSPLHATGFFYSQLAYLNGMEHCFEALRRCDELWIAGDWRNSRGCNMEYGFAKAKGGSMKERWINIKLIIVFGLLTALETASIVIFLNAPAPTYLKIIFGLIMASAAIASFIGMVYFIRECKKND